MTLLYLALVLPLDEILAPLILGEELQLLGIDGTASLFSDQVDRVLVLHTQLNQCCCYQHRSPAKSSDAVDSYACFRISLELCVHQREPPLNNLLGWGRPVRKGELGHSHATFAKVFSAVGLVCGANKVGDAVLLQQLDVRVHRHILGLFSDEKPHVVVLYLGGNGADSRPSHFALYWEGAQPIDYCDV